MSNPIVTIICLCYNQEKFVRESLDSAIKQTYTPIQLIIIDDASTDNSKDIIHTFLNNHPEVHFIALNENKGNCTAFNIALQQAQGKYIVDLAADDILLPDRIEKQVQWLEQAGEKYGAVFSDVQLIDETGKPLSTYYKRDKNGQLSKPIPTGNIYKNIVKHNTISSPSLLFRKKIMDELKGYDETLAYEDFDFMIRSSRLYWYGYIDEVLTLKRLVKGAHHLKFYQRKQHTFLHSTYITCQKIHVLNKTREESEALAFRIRYHMRQSLFTENRDLVKKFFHLLKTIGKLSLNDRMIYWCSYIPLPIYVFYKWYLKLRYKIY